MFGNVVVIAGYTRDDFWKLTLEEFNAIIEAYQKANSVDNSSGPPTQNDHDELMDELSRVGSRKK